MKKLIQSFFIYLITAAVFISGNGVVLSIHTCLSSADKNVSLFKQKSCCSEDDNRCESKCPDQHDNLSSKCCTSEVVYNKVSDPFTTQKSLTAPAIEFISSSLFSFSTILISEPDYKLFIPPSSSFSIPIVFHQLLI